MKVSHVSKEINEQFIQWCEKKYGSDLSGHIKVTKGKRHEYLAMILDYSEKGKIMILAPNEH